MQSRRLWKSDSDALHCTSCTALYMILYIASHQHEHEHQRRLNGRSAQAYASVVALQNAGDKTLRVLAAQQYVQGPVWTSERVFHRTRSRTCKPSCTISGSFAGPTYSGTLFWLGVECSQSARLLRMEYSVYAKGSIDRVMAVTVPS